MSKAFSPRLLYHAPTSKANAPVWTFSSLPIRAFKCCVFSLALTRLPDAQFGVAGSNYVGQHWGVLDYLAKPTLAPLPIHYEYYRNRANKIDVNAYAKANWRVINKAQEKLAIYGDLQYRYVRYSRNGINEENMEDLPLVANYTSACRAHP